ncbi:MULTISPECIES: nitroreductase family protein [Thermoactinomyces]|jgi:nitroreductase|uniref:nitroreductase family protein n=1 Tax=Thermoactinomyces TaxID=2023 RepID=UPI0005071839|nr:MULTISPECIES: nitroreductase family protein [Thermoactinomyces]KFZ41500.1 NAD(P)H nitroreductase [Thermoactinomyces sp. Gus2-1]KYQ86430.1 NAD(P)H nitroreductase [Thermoactinomyces sp. AS95]MBH8583341.1 nitroreductase family protein [Thermoactinomyces sp. CICC 10735]MBH8586488.1 nitroreductase family protein [Thermoactinomyces sp. CICC 10520]MBI0387465.1 nitroreductase family protein [Thermoactinomyces sp. CICC 24227]
MSTTKTMDAIEVMKARSTVRKYDPNANIPEEELNELLEIAIQAPSAWNLQHWRFLVITSKEMKEKLLPISYNQEQVVEAAATVAVLGDLQANETAKIVYKDAGKDIYDLMIGQVEKAYQNDRFARDEAFLNAGFAAMQLMLAAKAKGYDTCPIGGFNREKFVEEFRVPDRYAPVMLITIGKAAAPARPTTRLPLDQVVVKESF